MKKLSALLKLVLARLESQDQRIKTKQNDSWI